MSDPLVPSDMDQRQLVHAVSTRVYELSRTYLSMRGTELPLPESLHLEMEAFHRILNRHRSGDFRHTQGEKSAVRTIAQWSLDVWWELRNQPKRVLQWFD